MPSIAPNGRTWTLRIKRHRTTILLHADPIQKLASLRAELLLALQQTHPTGELDGLAIPQNADDIILAKPVDINDLSAGWQRLEQKTAFAGDEGGAANGKGKAKVDAATKAKQNVGAAGKLTDCPQGAGLRDGGIVAFRFRSEDEGRESGVEDGFEMLEEDKMVEGERDWDVVVPTIEETYAEEEAAAAGVGAG